MVRKNLFKAAIMVLSVSAIVSFGGCKKKSAKVESKNMTSTEDVSSTEKRNIAVTIKDDAGNEIEVTGEVISEQSSSREIVITDTDGNQKIIKEDEIVGNLSDGKVAFISDDTPARENNNPSSENNSSNAASIKDETGTGNNQSGENSKSEKNEPKTDNGKTHSHTWVEQIEVINHPEESHIEEVTEQVWVVDKAAWSEPQYRRYDLCSCGEKYYDLNDLSKHQRQNIISGIYTCGSSSSHYELVGYTDHPEEGHYETKTSTKKVIDKAAYSENLSSYYCSSCGVKK